MTDIIRMTPQVIAATAREAIASKLYGKFKTIEEATIVLRKGAEMGLSPMQALDDFHVINGYPSMGADAMVAHIRRSGKCRYWVVTESREDSCTIKTARTDEPNEIVHEVKFTKKMAEKAGLWGKAGPWTQYPETMLEHRAATRLARMAFSDIVRGVYSPDEARNIPQREESTEHATVTVDSPRASETVLDNSQAIADCAASMRSAQSKDELVLCAGVAKALVLSLDERAQLLGIYNVEAQRIALNGETLSPDAWRNRMAASKNQYECAGAFRKRISRFRSLGVLSEYADVFVQRMIALGVDESDAKAKAVEIMDADTMTAAEAVAAQ